MANKHSEPRPWLWDPANPLGEWVGGLAEWTIGDTAFLSIAFTWLLPEARNRAVWYRTLGYKVICGGPAVHEHPKYLADVAEWRRDYPNAVSRHNPAATFATRGCNERCSFCNVWRIDGDFTYYPDFTPFPILCDNNLSAIEVKYQDFIIEKYEKCNMPLMDANSGFEPKSFDGGVFSRWRKINKGPWRFGFDETGERDTVRRVMAMLRAANVSPRRVRPYVLIGNEPPDECLGRIREAIEWGGEPHVQPLIKHKSLEKKAHVSRAMGWTPQLLTDMARWANRRIWRYAAFEEYRRSAKADRADRFDKQQGLFV